MANTFELIASSTVGSGGAASIDFTSIPSTYTDLCVKVSARSTSAQPQENLMIELNGSSANFTRRALEGDGGTAYSYSGSTGMVGYVVGNGATSNTFNNADIYIPNYASSNYKSISTDDVQEGNTATIYMQMTAVLWSSTAAITSLTLKPSTNNFVQYSTAYLFGIKSS